MGACPELKLLAEARTRHKPQALRPIVSPVQSIVPVAIAGICETRIVSVNNSLLHQRIQSSDSKKFWTCFLKRSLSYVLNNVMASRNGLPPNMRSYNTWRPLKELQDTSQARWNSLARSRALVVSLARYRFNSDASGAILDRITEPKFIKSRLGVPILTRVLATGIDAKMAEGNE